MNPINFNNSSKKGNILFVPLDWGLGHITRCIPLINEFRSLGSNIFFAGENKAEILLKGDFQDFTFIYKKGYQISYSANRYWFALKIFAQLPGIFISIYNEHKWLKKVVKKYSINAIISDNRPGLYHGSVPAVYVTHQLGIKAGNSFSEKIIQRIHFFFIKKFNACWIPDFEGVNNLAGELSHPANVPNNITYIGPLSRFMITVQRSQLYHLLIILSGPEPQRSIFEKLLLSQIKNHHGNILFVRGLPEKEPAKATDADFIAHPNVLLKNHLSAKQLNAAILQSEMVISRSGYTTVMDLIKLKQKAILIPTPGQTEQEYLARYLMQQGFFFTASQQNFVLEQVLKNAAAFPFSIPSFNMEQYKNAVSIFVQSL